MRRSILAIAAVLVAMVFALCGAPALALASPYSRAYEKVNEPISGNTYVFLAENITNNHDKTHPADRLLTADVTPASNQDGTSTTSFSIDDEGVLWGMPSNLQSYEYVITKVEGVTDESSGYQAYTIRRTGQGDYANQYLGVTQNLQYTINEWSGSTDYLDIYYKNADGELTEFDGALFPTYPFVYLSNNPCYWYWDPALQQFYTFYQSDIAGSGTPVEGFDETGRSVGTVRERQGASGVFGEDGERYLVVWDSYTSYCASNDSNYLPYQGGFSIGEKPQGSPRLYLCGVNAPNTPSSGNLVHTTLAETLVNPLYVRYMY